MWILVVEALGALSLFLFIVWWTLGPTHRQEREALRQLTRAEADAKPSDAESTVGDDRRADR
jgi:hypothetical protein